MGFKLSSLPLEIHRVPLLAGKRPRLELSSLMRRGGTLFPNSLYTSGMFCATLLLLNSPRVSLSGIDSKVPLLAGKRSVLECSPAEVRGGTFSLQTEQNSLPRLSSMFLPLESSASLSFGSCLSGVGPGLSAQRQDRLSIPLPLTHSLPWLSTLLEELRHIK